MLLPLAQQNRKLTLKYVQTATHFIRAKIRLLILPAVLNVSENDLRKLPLKEKNKGYGKNNFGN